MSFVFMSLCLRVQPWRWFKVTGPLVFLLGVASLEITPRSATHSHRLASLTEGRACKTRRLLQEEQLQQPGLFSRLYYSCVHYQEGGSIVNQLEPVRLVVSESCTQSSSKTEENCLSQQQHTTHTHT